MKSDQLLDDKEIDLVELIQLLWSRKGFIALCTFVVFLFSLLYAFFAPQVWTASVKVSQPSAYQFSNYSNSINEVLSFIPNKSQFDSSNLKDLNKSDYLFDLFLSNFNSSVNKIDFLKQTELFKEKVGVLKQGSAKEQDAILSGLIKKISSSQQTSEFGNEKIFELNFAASTAEMSASLLNGYINYIDNITKSTAINNLIANANNYQSFLSQKLALLQNQAQAKLKMDIQKTQYSLDIANGAKVSKPISNLKYSGIFNTQLGSEILNNKLSVLKGIKDISILNPKISQLIPQLKAINDFDVSPKMAFNVYKKQSELMVPFSRTSPHRVLIMALGLLIGLVISCLIVLTKAVFENK